MVKVDLGSELLEADGVGEGLAAGLQGELLLHRSWGFQESG